MDATRDLLNLEKAYLIRSASSCHSYGLQSKKAMQIVSPNLQCWSLVCLYSDGG